MAEAETESFLIDLVEANPCLYDKRHSNYKNKVLKRKIWESVGIQMHQSGSDCCTKWESLRSQCLAHQRKLKNPSGSGKAKRPYFRHEDRMKFLSDANYDESTYSNLDFVDKSEVLADVFEEADVMAEMRNEEEITLPSASPSTVSHTVNPPKSKKPKLDSVGEEMLRYLKTDDDDEYTVFGKFVATKLRRIGNISRKKFRDAEHFIHTFLNEVENELVDNE